MTVITLDGNPYTSGSPITVLGPHSLAVSAADIAGNPVSKTIKFLVFAFPAGGAFVIGDKTPQAIGTNVTFWSAEWAGSNSLSGGAAPDAFKGFADNLSPNPPTCGDKYTTDPGNSAGVPAGPLPAYMGVLVSSSVSKTGRSISGNIVHIAVVDNISGYATDPGHAGIGTVVATAC